VQTVHFDPLHDRRFSGVFGRHHEPPQPLVPGLDRKGQHTPYGPQRSVERELAREHRRRKQLPAHLGHRGEKPHHFNLGPTGSSLPADTVSQPASPAIAGLGLRAATDLFQRQLIEQTLTAHDGNWAASARALDLDGGNLHRLARRLGLKA
jgi:transcriptional regulator with GAF, ATPase, and Fis domain